MYDLSLKETEIVFGGKMLSCECNDYTVDEIKKVAESKILKRTCSISCSGKHSDGSTWTNSCSASGCDTCIPSSCGEFSCAAGCAS